MSSKVAELKAKTKAKKAKVKKIVSLLPQQHGLKPGDKEKYLKAKKNIKNLSKVDIVRLALPKGLENSLQEIREKAKPKKKIVKAVPKEVKPPKKKIVKAVPKEVKPPRKKIVKSVPKEVKPPKKKIVKAVPKEVKPPKKKIVKAVPKEVKPPKKKIVKAVPKEVKPPKKKIVKKVIEKPKPKVQDSARPRRRGVPRTTPKPKAPPKSPVLLALNSIKAIGNETYITLPNEALNMFKKYLKRILDSDLPFSIDALKQKFKKEILETKKKVRQMNKKLGVFKSYEEEKQSKKQDYTRRENLLTHMNEVLADFGKKDQTYRDSLFNYLKEAEKVDPAKVEKTRKYYTALKAVDTFHDDKKYSKPTEQEKEQNKKNMKILKDMAKDDLYGVFLGDALLTYSPKSKVWENARNKLFSTNKFKLRHRLLNFDYKTAIAKMKLELNK